MPLPWAGQIVIDRTDPGKARWTNAASGVRKSLQKTSYTPDVLRWVLVVALALDIQGRENPRKRRGINNHGDLVAFLIHHMSRIAELSFLRGKDLRIEQNCLLLPGTKTETSVERWCPIQESYEPWHARLVAAVPGPEASVFPSSEDTQWPIWDPALGQMTNLPAADTNARKVGAVLHAAGVKTGGERTHIFRAVHASIATAAMGVEYQAIMAGHRLAGDTELQDHYMRRSAYISALPPEAWTYFPDLGAPDELELEARKALREGRIPGGPGDGR